MLTGVDHGDGVGVVVASFAMQHGEQAAAGVDPRRWLMTTSCRALPLGGGGGG